MKESLKVINLIERLGGIARQMDDYSRTISPERTYNMLCAEINSASADITSSEDNEDNQEKIREFHLFLQKSWQDFFDQYSNQDLNRILKAQRIRQDDTKVKTINKESLLQQLEENKVSIRKPKGSENQFIMNLLGSHRDRFYEAWSIENTKTEKLFSAFLNQKKDVSTRLLWHGSGNENWWSIINSGLITDPQDVIIEGKMFGDGIYFAVKAEKAFSFSSILMANKRKKLSNASFLGLYEVAYGQPFDVSIYDPVFSTLNYENLQEMKAGSNCLHAHSGVMLNHDEIVIYKKEQATIRYLVELRD